MSYPEFLTTYWPQIGSGMMVTMWIWFQAVILGTVLSLALALLRLSPWAVVRGAALVPIEIFRGTPILLQLFWLNFVLPLFGFSLPRELTGVLTLALNFGAYGSEAIKGAILSVPRGQTEVAVALNMTPFQRMSRIILPQATLLVLPTWNNFCVEYLKYSAIVALIAIPDLMFELRLLNNRLMMPMATFGTALIAYYVMSRLIIIPVFEGLERRCARWMGVA